MGKVHGINTRSIAEELKARLHADQKRFSGIDVFYDHGDSSNAEVCQPTTYIGKRYGRDATLSGLDIVLAKDNNVFLAIEIEESQVRPKTVLGDIFGVVVADKMRIRKKTYSIKGTTLIVAIADEGKGKQSKKYLRLERHIKKYLKTRPSQGVSKVRIVSCPEDDLVRRIERLIRLETGKHRTNR